MKISDAKTLLTEIFLYNMRQMEAGKSHKSYVVPIFIGDPGVGKTAIPNQVAEELGVKCHTTIIAQYDAGEMAGLAFPQDVEYDFGDGNIVTEKRMMRLRPNYLPDPYLEEGKVGVWNFDEL